MQQLSEGGSNAEEEEEEEAAKPTWQRYRKWVVSEQFLLNLRVLWEVWDFPRWRIILIIQHKRNNVSTRRTETMKPNGVGTGGGREPGSTSVWPTGSGGLWWGSKVWTATRRLPVFCSTGELNALRLRTLVRSPACVRWRKNSCKSVGADYKLC